MAFASLFKSKKQADGLFRRNGDGWSERQREIERQVCVVCVLCREMERERDRGR